ncbi:MAG: hypothetical protein KF858_13520 [Candidatus Sumerlaeia bacterium]|nr:hypothetical protein [Candidatus Sumerlaeia bacterium]
MKVRLVAPALLLVFAFALTGCGVIYSKQHYGSPGTRSISADATKADVFANLGQPNAIYRHGEDEVFVYKYAEGENILGLVSKIRREDTVVIMDNTGAVRWVQKVPVGRGLTILSGPALDATHPVRTSTLLFEPENYSVSEEK